MVDYLRQPKAGYYALQKAYQPLLPSIEPVTEHWQTGKANTLRLWAINDSWSACESCTLKWQIKQNQRVLEKGAKPLTIPADSGQMIAEVTATPDQQGEVKIIYWIEDKNGKVAGKNDRTEQVGQ